MSFFKLDLEKCKRDGICSAVCVAGIIRNDENRVPYIEERNNANCIACGLCVAFCPHDACSVEKLDETQFKKIDREALPSFEVVDNFMKSRRSVRSFRDKEISDEDIADVMDIVRYTPSAKNTQATRWVLVKGAENTNKVSEHIADFCESIDIEAAGDNEALKKQIVFNKALARAYRKGRDVFMRGAPYLLVCVMPKDYEWRIEDGNMALAHFEIAATAKGLGACWAGYFTRTVKEYQPLRDMLGITDDEYVAGGQMFGIPVYKTRAVPSRKPLNITYK